MKLYLSKFFKGVKIIYVSDLNVILRNKNIYLNSKLMLVYGVYSVYQGILFLLNLGMFHV